MRHGFALVGKWKPEPVARAKAGVAVHTQTEGAWKKLLLDDFADGLVFNLHGAFLTPRYHCKPAL